VVLVTEPVALIRPIHIVSLLTLTALLTQGFQCASPELSVAKKAYNQKEYAKAKLSVEKVLSAEQDNCEARVLLGDINAGLSDSRGMVDAYRSALSCSTVTKEQQNYVSRQLYVAWVGQYNSGITKYNEYVASRNVSDLNAAATYFKEATKIKPEFSESFVLLGQAHLNQNDTAAALAAFRSWWELENPGYEILRKKSVHIGQPRGLVLRNLGTPMQTRVDSSLDRRTTFFKDKFDVGGRDVYVFSAQEGTKDAAVEGWTYNPSSMLIEDERWRTHTISLLGLKELAFVAYKEGNVTESYDWSTIITTLRPGDTEFIIFRTQLLQEMGKGAEALADMRAMVEREPKNAEYRLPYALLLSRMSQQRDAIEQFKVVLELDPKNETALYNLGAEYKNAASRKEQAELDKKDKDKKYKIDQAFMSDLAQAATYFERLRQSVKYRDDLVVMEQLANVYEVRQDAAKLKSIVQELEALEDQYRTSKEYYRIMTGLYGRSKMLDKMQDAQAKGESLK